MNPEVSPSEPSQEAIPDDEPPKREKKVKAKKKKAHFGDLGKEQGFQLENGEFIGNATWSEVCHSCWIHSPKEWLAISFSIILMLVCLYCFGLGLDFLGSGAKVMTSCSAGELFAHNANPVSAVMIGLLTTVLIQSSSTTTSIIVSLVGADNNVVGVQQGIYMIMGANIGTTVTNTIVSLGHFSDPEQLGDAFAGATIHDLFNFMSVAVLFPIEVCTGYLFEFTKVLVRGANTHAGDAWEGPAKKLISPLAARILIANKKVINAVAGGGDCSDFYPVECADPDHPTYKTCTHVGLIACDKNTGLCPAFFSSDAGRFEDQVAGFVVFFIGLFIIFTSLFALAFLIQQLLLGISLRVIHKATAINNYFLIFIGAGITMLIQSSSTTTSFLTPVVGVGALRLEQMFAFTIGANVGTTITSVLAALVTDGNDALQVALAHLLFNVTGMMIWYPIPAVRQIPLEAARRLGKAAKTWRGTTLVYLAVMFFLVPGMFLGLSAIFETGTTAWTVFGSLLSAFLGILLLLAIRWMYFQGGRQRVYDVMAAKQFRYRATRSLPDDMERVQNKLVRLFDYADLSRAEKLAPGFEAGNVSTNRGWCCFDRTREDEAVRNLVLDMKTIDRSLPLLFHHLGVPEEFEMENIDIEEDATESPDNEGPVEKVGTTGDSGTGFWNKIPRLALACLVLGTPLAIFGLIALFMHESKASKGAAGFLTILLGLTFAYALQFWIYDNGRERCIQYFEGEERINAAISSLPDDMAQVKADIERLFLHYRLSPDEKKGVMRH